MESYLKFTFSRNLLIFTIAWMGTRDIFIALIITLVFIIFMDYLFNEESAFCCLSSQFKDYHIGLIENDKVSIDEVNKAKQVLEKFENQSKTQGGSDSSISQTSFQSYQNLNQ
jgi:hypothetical protein